MGSGRGNGERQQPRAASSSIPPAPLRVAFVKAYHAVEDDGVWRTTSQTPVVRNNCQEIPVLIEDILCAVALAVPSGELGAGAFFGLEFESMSRVK